MDVETGRKNTGLLVIGIILVVIGGVWTGQGAGLLMGSFMTGKPMWLVIGIVTAACGLVVTWRSLRASKRL